MEAKDDVGSNAYPVDVNFKALGLEKVQVRWDEPEK
jgi:hypothetical protein